MDLDLKSIREFIMLKVKEFFFEKRFDISYSREKFIKYIVLKIFGGVLRLEDIFKESIEEVDCFFVGLVFLNFGYYFFRNSD